MRTYLRHASTRFALLAVVLAGCTGTSDAPLSPTAPRGTGLLSGLLSVPLLQRLLPLGQSYSASATIGSAGGTISIPQAGMTITFPAGAVSSPVLIRATAVAGSNVAYTFEPHGLQFAKPVTITQNLALTQIVQNLLQGPSLQGSYFASDSQLGNGTAVVDENIPATFSLLQLRTTFPIRHFSGYAVSKKTGGYITSSGTRAPVGHTAQ